MGEIDRRAAEGRPPLIVWTAMLLLGAVTMLNRSIVDWTHRDGLWLPHAGTMIGRDFTNLYFGGRFGWAGVDVYDLSAYQGLLHQVGILSGQNYSYPPATLAIGAALSQLPYGGALLLWWLGSVALFVLAARRTIGFAWPWLLLLPTLAEMPNGQYGILASALWLWSFRGSGVAPGLLTLKPHLGILLAPTLIAKRRWRQVAVAAAVALLLWGAGEALFHLTRAYLTAGAQTQIGVLLRSSEEPYFAGIPSTYVRLRHNPFAWAAHLAVSAAALAMLWRLRHLPLDRLVFPAATATFLVLPYSFAYDMAAVSLGFAVLLDHDWGAMGWRQRAMTIGGYVGTAFPAIAPPLLLAGLWVQSERLLADADRGGDASQGGDDPAWSRA
ncbi:glycosyltransferase family 87 protein [Sphingomonas sp. ASV193]|uniref:glycosyltransferase family 87 protein n=1 Tax=Sphingomonas sp. ASV193 TaxID=3144405 RepID=UPI0032E8C170